MSTSSQSRSVINEDLLSCPICLQIPEREIFQCQNGHSICGRCLSSQENLGRFQGDGDYRGGRCPQCRVSMNLNSATRNRALEEILDSLEFDCPQKFKGCSVRMCRGRIAVHSQMECEYGQRPEDLRHFEVFPKPLSPGAKIIIHGNVLEDALRFNVDICDQSLSSHNTAVLFHFNPRLDPSNIPNDVNVVVRNTWFPNRGWGHEERHSIPSIPFRKGSKFTIEIWCELDKFHVAVNGKSFVDYKYRLPVDLGRYLKIVGGCKITKVETRL